MPSLGPFGRGCCPPLSPATMVSTGFLQLHHCLVAAQVCSSSFPAQVKLKANRSDSKPVSLSFNQHKTFACSLGFKISICPSALWWFCHHPFCVVWALQSTISKTGNLLFLCRQLAFPLVGSIVKQQHPGTKAQSSALLSQAVCRCCSTSPRFLQDLWGSEDPPRALTFSPFLQKHRTLQAATSLRAGRENRLHLSSGHLTASSLVLLQLPKLAH